MTSNMTAFMLTLLGDEERYACVLAFLEACWLRDGRALKSCEDPGEGIPADCGYQFFGRAAVRAEPERQRVVAWAGGSTV